MTTTPKAHNYNVRRPVAAPNAQASVKSAPETIAERLRAIEAERLDGRHLRQARRNAQKHGLNPASDIDAVRLLRDRGLDPFAPSRVMDLVVSNTGKEVAAADGGARLPVRAETAKLPATEVLGGDDRAREIRRMQRDIARRRQWRMALLAARLAVFVLLPTAIAGYYYYRIATPLYASESIFVVEAASNSGGGGGGGALGALAQAAGGAGLAGGNDAIKVQTYLQGRDAMLRLDREHGFRAAFSGPDIDPLLRLAPDASIEDAYSLYRKQAKIGYDPTEGIIRMTVSAPDPQLAEAFSWALIGYAEEHVGSMSNPIREAQVSDAQQAYADAEAAVTLAQQQVVDLKQQRGVLSAEAEVSSAMGRIAGLESELDKKRLELRQLLDNSEPNQARVNSTQAQIDRLAQMVGEARDNLTATNESGASLARITAELAIAEAELAIRQEMRGMALQQLIASRQEAHRQASYLLTVEPPVATDEPAFPRAFENTLLALLIMSGIYLVVSLTASILREQVAS